MESPRYSSPAQGPVRPTKRPSVTPASPLLRILFPLLWFIAGVLVGALGLSLAVMLANPDRPAMTVTASSQNATLVVQPSTSYVNQVAGQKANSFGLPGTVENVNVTFVHNGPVSITGDDEVSLLGLSVVRHFRLDAQLYVDACKPMIHVLHADFSGVPVTGIVASFEQNINQQLQGSVADLPPGFTYCITAIRTEPEGPVVTFSAQSLT